MTKRTLFQIVTLTAVLAIALAACAPAATPAPAPAPTQPPAAPAATQPPAAPAATPTVPPPNCAKMDGMPTAAAGELGSADKPIVMTFVPSGDVGTITKAGTAIADCLSQMTGLKYQIEVGTNFAASIEAMGSGKAQFGFLNTFSVLLAEAKYQVVPVLVALRNYKGKLENYYQGQFIANNNSGIKSIADLKGKTFCFVDPNSTSGEIIPRIVMKANGIDPDKDLKSYDGCRLTRQRCHRRLQGRLRCGFDLCRRAHGFGRGQVGLSGHSGQGQPVLSDRQHPERRSSVHQGPRSEDRRCHRQRPAVRLPAMQAARPC